MKIKHGMPEYDEQVHNDLISSGWKPLKEPASIKAYVFLSIPFMIINIAISSIISSLFMDGNSSYEFMIKNTYEIITGLVGIVLFTVILIALHELLHLVFIPDFIKSDKVYVGFTSFGGYAYTEASVTKQQMCIICLAPYILISIILNIVLGILNLYSFPILAFFFLNALGSCVDMLSLSLVLFQVPKGSLLINNALKTYYKQV